jgi:DNA-binding IclR family transcriptional regulator
MKTHAPRPVAQPLALAPQMPSSLGSSPQLLERTFTVLSLFTPDQLEWTATEIGRSCGLAVPTAHRILSALHRNGFLSRDELSKRYRLGPMALRLGRTAALSVDIRSVSAPVLRRLATRTRETALLTVVSDSRDKALCLERVETTDHLRLSVEPGREVSLHAGASQKVLLAHLPRPDVERYIQGPLPRYASSTIVDPAQLQQELSKIHGRGWATSFEETNQGVWGVAMALLDESGHPVAALGLAGPQSRRPSQLHPWLSVLNDGLGEIARQLGLPGKRNPRTTGAGAGSATIDKGVAE